MSARDALIWVVAAMFAGVGVAGLVAPARVLAIFGVTVGTADGRSEVRAVYGGFGLAVAAVLGVAAAGGGEAREGILVAIGVAAAGMAAGRLVARAVEPPSGFWPVWFWFWVEAAMGVALLCAAWA